MSYLCDLCTAVVPPGRTRRLHTVLRNVPCRRLVDGLGVNSTRTEIAAEVPVCGACDILLGDGAPLGWVRSQRRPEVVAQRKREQRAKMAAKRAGQARLNGAPRTRLAPLLPEIVRPTKGVEVETPTTPKPPRAKVPLLVRLAPLVRKVTFGEDE